MRRILIGGVLLFYTLSGAQAENGMILANQLGALLGAEDACHLSYDQAAIQRFIASKVPENDLSFGSMLQLMVTGEKIEIKDMSRSTLTAFCSQSERVARSHGFIR